MHHLVPLPLSSHSKPVDSFSQASALETELRRTLAGEVRFDRGSRALYATDGSNYRQIPIGLVVPRNAEDVIAAVAACRKYGAPVLARGAGTSLAGQCCNVAVVLDFTKYMNQIVELDPRQRYARVQPGVVLDSLRNKAEAHKLTFAPDPSTHNRCTIGGMIGNNSCGTHSLLGGKTVDNIEELQVLLYDGSLMTVGATSDEEFDSIIRQGGRPAEIYAKLRTVRDQYSELIRARFPRIPRRVSGYNLDELLPERGFHVARSLVGTEGTCAIVLQAKVRLIESPQHRKLVGLGYGDAFLAADHVPEILKFRPIGLEGFEGSIVDGLKRKGAPNLDLLPEGRGFLLVEFGSNDASEANQQALQLIDWLKQRRRTTQRAPLLRERSTGGLANTRVGATRCRFCSRCAARMGGMGRLRRSSRKTGRLLARYSQADERIQLSSAHFTAILDTVASICESASISKAKKEFANTAEFIDRAADLVVGYGGSLSGEHGDGQSRGALLPKMFGPDLMEAFRAIQVSLGSRQQDESPQGDQCLLAYRESPAWG